MDPTYDCLECMGAVNDLHPANLFSFPIPEDMTYEDELLDYLEDVYEFTRNEKGNN